MVTNSFRRIENLHIGIWLIKDLSWVSHFRLFGMFMIFPTLVIGLWITWKMRKNFAELAHNLAVCSWISANSIWMTGEFYYNDGTRNIATGFFVFGIILILASYLRDLIRYFRFKALRQKA